MNRYFLDTCALVWLLNGNSRMAKIAEDIQYYTADFALPIDALKELFYLKCAGKIKIDISFKELADYLNGTGIKICQFDGHSLETLYNLPFFPDHADPTDRNIIAHSIAEKRTLISGDLKFERYSKYGLNILSI